MKCPYCNYSPLGKSRVRYYLARIYKLCREQEPKISLVKFNDGSSGETDFTNMKVDYRRDILSTFVHECLHILYPEWAEEKILTTEKSIIAEANKKQIKRLLNHMTDLV